MNARRWVLLGAGASYLLSLIYPALRAGSGPNLTSYHDIHGYEALIMGPVAFLNLSGAPEWFISWLANPLALGALCIIIKGTPTKKRAAASFLPFLLSTVCLTITSTIVSDHPVPAILGPGAYFWMASFLLLGVASLASLITAERRPDSI